MPPTSTAVQIRPLDELEAVQAHEVPAARIISSNPIKSVAFIQAAHRAGVDRFAVDSRAELVKLARVYAEQGPEAARALADPSAAAEAEADRQALLDDKGADANHATERIVEIQRRVKS